MLVQRVIRLLLDGVPPEKILCITFTKAAAANMAERVFSTLGHWVTLDDDALDAAIRDAGIAQPDAKLRMRARELFACALETPGGLKVQTIHALCTRLLQQFPFEANVPARFAVLDDRDQTEMMERANLGGAARGRARSRQRDRPRADDRDGQRRRRHLQGRGARGLPQPRSLHGLDRRRRQRRRRGGADCRPRSASIADDRIEDVERDIVDGPNLPRSRWEEIAAILETGSKTDQDQAARLREALVLYRRSAGRRISQRVPAPSDRAPRKSVVTKKFARRQSGRCAALFEREADRLGPLIERRRAVTARDRTEALLHIATAAAAQLPPREAGARPARL